MKLSQIKQIVSSIVAEELNEMYSGYPDDEQDDGYSNEFQRDFAHSQATTPIHNDRKKAEELAKQGKYVVLVGDCAHCKSTDAVLGVNWSIHSVYDNEEDAKKEIEKLANHADYVDMITPDSIQTPKSHPSYESGSEDVPFEEGVGYVSDKDMARDPKHIKGERWRVKFQSSGDLKKHGNTEMSSVNETISKKQLKRVIREIVEEMWNSKNDVEGDEINEVSPPGWEGTVKGMKKHKNIDNPWALAWSMKNKGMKSHKKEGVLQDPFKTNQTVDNFAKPRTIHSISKPVRNSETNEWVVKWMTNGKRDENKTYYTDDKKDAFDTYEMMIQNAQQMNKTGNR